MAVTGQVVGDPDELRRPLGAQVGLAGQEGGEPRRVEVGAGPEQQGGHHLVAHPGVGHGVDGGQHHVGVAGEDGLDRGGGEVLAVHPEPVVVAAGEVEEVVGVPVAEVTGPVPAVADPGGVGVVVAPVALESGPARLADHLADGLVGVEQPAVLVEDPPRALLAGLRVEDDRAGEGPAQRPSRGVRRAGDGRPALGGAVGVLDGAAEPLGEPGHVGLGGLVAECPAQRVVGIVGLLRGGQHVGEGLAHVVEVGHPVLPDIGEELGGAEPVPEGHGGPGGQGRGPPGHQGVGVEQRHRDVADVVFGDLEHLGDDGADAGEPPLAAQARLGGPGGPRGEEQESERVLGRRRCVRVGEGCAAADASQAARRGRRGRGRRWGSRRPGCGRGQRRPQVVALDQRHQVPGR